MGIFCGAVAYCTTLCHYPKGCKVIHCWPHFAERLKWLCVDTRPPQNSEGLHLSKLMTERKQLNTCSLVSGLQLWG